MHKTARMCQANAIMRMRINILHTRLLCNVPIYKMNDGKQIPLSYVN